MVIIGPSSQELWDCKTSWVVKIGPHHLPSAVLRVLHHNQLLFSKEGRYFRSNCFCGTFVSSTEGCGGVVNPPIMLSCASTPPAGRPYFSFTLLATSLPLPHVSHLVSRPLPTAIVPISPFRSWPGLHSCRSPRTVVSHAEPIHWHLASRCPPPPPQKHCTLRAT